MRKLFISYSHQDDKYLDLFHKHLANLKRENHVSTWTDRDILTGKLDENIWKALEESQIFIALLSPDYIASSYCYDKEFKTALQRVEDGNLIIVPIIMESCDWQSSPFSDFKILPKDAKPVANWDNPNNAMVDVIQTIRRLLQAGDDVESDSHPTSPTSIPKNYRIKRDFDSIQKLEFIEESYVQIRTLIIRFIEELQGYDNIKARMVVDKPNEMEFIIVNRNKIATEATVNIGVSSNMAGLGFQAKEKQLFYTVNRSFQNNNADNIFSVGFDDYDLFWTNGGMNRFFQQGPQRLSSSDIANKVWEDTLAEVGIS